jgi:hypothetical protein
MKYNKLKHLELVERFLAFKKLGKNMHDLYQERKNEYLELNNYQYLLIEYISWTRREEFIICLENYVDDKIDFEDFECIVSKLYWKSSNEENALELDLKGLKKLKYDPQSEGFGSWPSVLFRLFEEVEDEYLTEEDITDYVRNIILPKIESYLFRGTSGSPRNNDFSKSDSTTTAFWIRPVNMTQEEFNALTMQQKRNLPDPRDGFIHKDGHPDLVVRFGQVKFKTPQYGKVFGLPTKKNGKSAKTNKNALALRDNILTLANRDDTIYYDNGTYKNGVGPSYSSVNLYSPELNNIAIFKKGPDRKVFVFTTVFQPTDLERTFFEKSNGNFVTEANLENPKIIIKYNKIKHLELVKSFLAFKKLGKNMHDLYQENEKEFLELSNYQSLLNDWIFWAYREQFIICLENYVHDKIDFEGFQSIFSKLYWKSRDEKKVLELDLKGLENLKYDPQSEGFGNYLNALFRQFEQVEDEYYTEEDDVKDYACVILQEIQSCL